jgi:glycosyltransferase involved in cell wall biosynthesis
MPVYNAEVHVAEAISSILAQTCSNFEFIIVDDGSTDASINVIRQYAEQDARIRPLYLNHCGQAGALNAGIEMAQGQLIAHMDNDDIALPERFDIQLAWMRKTGVDICGGQLKRFGLQSGHLWFPETHEAIRNELLFRVSLHHGSSLLRTEIAKKHLFNRDTPFVDYEILTRLALLYKLGNVPQILLKYRSHPLQTHIIYKKDFFTDMNLFRKNYFFQMYPDATQNDFNIISCLARNMVSATLEDLQRAGLWLARLAQTPDIFLRRKMADRWRSACQRSSFLGLRCYRLYNQHYSLFKVPEVRSNSLWISCALRLKADSRFANIVRSVKNKQWIKRHEIT